MSQARRNAITELIQENRTAIKNCERKKELLINPLIEDNLKNDFIEEIDFLIASLNHQLIILTPYIRDMRSKILDITEETTLCAVYLLLCSVIKLFDSILILAKQGNYSSIMILLRAIDENLMQCTLYSYEFHHKQEKNISKWFSGDLVMHGAGREKMQELLNKQEGKEDIKGISAYIYEIESQIAHGGYSGMLENISPFTEDYDLNGATGYHRTVKSLKLSAAEEMKSLIINLKVVYEFVLKDTVRSKQLSCILDKYSTD